MIEAVWGDVLPERASRSVSTLVSNLRDVLGDAIVRDGNRYALRVERGEVNAVELADRVGLALQRQGSEPAETAASIRRELEEAFMMVHQMLPRGR